MEFHTITIFNDGFPNPTITTVVTPSLDFVDWWILTVVASTDPPRLIGLGLEVLDAGAGLATLQFSIDNKCLIYRIFPPATFSQTLITFLVDPTITFLGFGLRSKLDMLMLPTFRDDVNYVDMGVLLNQERNFENLGLQSAHRNDVVMHVLENVDVFWPMPAGRWDMPVLPYQQARYACIRAFIALQMGMLLFKGDTLLVDIYIRVLLGS